MILSGFLYQKNAEFNVCEIKHIAPVEKYFNSLVVIVVFLGDALKGNFEYYGG